MSKFLRRKWYLTNHASVFIATAPKLEGKWWAFKDRVGHQDNKELLDLQVRSFGISASSVEGNGCWPMSYCLESKQYCSLPNRIHVSFSNTNDSCKKIHDRTQNVAQHEAKGALYGTDDGDSRTTKVETDRSQTKTLVNSRLLEKISPIASTFE